MSEENYEGLSEQEIAALKDDDELVIDDANEDDELSASEPDKSEDEVVAKQEESEVVEEVSEENEEDQVVNQFIPKMKAEVHADVDQRIIDLEKSSEKLLADLDEGEITMAEYHAKNREYNKQINELQTSKQIAKFAENQNNETSAQRWEWAQDEFFGQEKNKFLYEDPDLYGALNSAVKRISSLPDASKMTEMQVLNEAAKQIRSKFAIATDPVTPKPTTMNNGKKPVKPVIPNTLSHIPAADKNVTKEGEFSGIDDLSGMELENAIARMSPEQQERYSRA